LQQGLYVFFSSIGGTEVLQSLQITTNEVDQGFCRRVTWKTAWIQLTLQDAYLEPGKQNERTLVFKSVKENKIDIHDCCNIKYSSSLNQVIIPLHNIFGIHAFAEICTVISKKVIFLGFFFQPFQFNTIF